MTEIEKTNNRYLKIVVIVSAVILLTVFILLALGVFSRDTRTDEEKLVDAGVKTMFADSKITTYHINIDDLEIDGLDGIQAQVLKGVLKDLNIELVVYQEASTKTMKIEFALKQKTIPILDGELFVNDELIAISVPTLYDKTIYGYTGNLSGLLASFGMDIDLPKITESQKDVHQEIMDDIELKLLDRDYESIEQLDAVTYYDMIVQFLGIIETGEMVTESVEIDGETVQRNHYQTQTDVAAIIGLFGDIFEASKNDEALNALMDSHKDAMDTGMGDSKDESMTMIDGFDGSSLGGSLGDIGILTDIYVSEDEMILESLTAISFSIESGIPGLLEFPLEVVIELESSSVIMDEPLIIEPPTLDGGVDISAMSPEELGLFGEELMESIINGLSQNQLFQMMGIDAATLFN
jgi:hypothetical protein